MRKNRSWFKLITFSAVAAIVTGLGFASLIAGGALVFAGGLGVKSAEGEVQAAATPTPPSSEPQASSPDQKTISGIVTDERCGARHLRDGHKSASECARMCVQAGSHYVLVTGTRTYALTGSLEELQKRAGQRVDVVGTLQGNSIVVSSVVE